MSGTTIYGSNVVCSPVGKFTSCIDTGTGYFSGALNGTSATFSNSVIVGTTALLNFGPTTSFVGMSGNNSTGALQLYANNTQVLGFAASTGAATFTGKTNIVKDIADYAFTITNTNASGYGMYIQAGSTNNAIDVYNAAGTTQLFKLTGTGAATFSSSVTATSYRANITSIGSYFQSYDGTDEIDFGSRKSISGTGNSYDAMIYTSNASSAFYVFTGGNFTTPKLTIASTGAATFSSSVTATSLGIGLTASAKIQAEVGNTTSIGLFSASGLAITSGGGSTGNIYQIAFGYGGGTYGSSALYGLTESSTGYNTGALVFATRTLTTDTAPIERMRITSTGIACFACQICVKEAVYINGSFPGVKLDRAGTSAQSDINWKDAGTSVWSIGTAVRAVGSSLDFYSYYTGDNVFKLTQTGITCFSNTVCAPTFAGSAVRGSGNLDLNGNAGYLTLRTGDVTRLFVGSTGGVSVGAVTDPGANNLIVAGQVCAPQFTSGDGTVSNPYGTWTTLFTVPSGLITTYIVHAVLYNQGGYYTNTVMLGVNAGAISINHINNPGGACLRVNGYDVQVTNGSGATQSINYRYIRLG